MKIESILQKLGFGRKKETPVTGVVDPMGAVTPDDEIGDESFIDDEAPENRLYRRPRERTEEIGVKRLSSYLPYNIYDKEFGLYLIEADKGDTVESVGFCIEINPQTGATREMAASLMGLFKGTIPDSTGFQFFLYGSPDVEDFYDAFRRNCIHPDDFPDDEKQRERAELLQMMVEKRIEHLKDIGENGFPQLPNSRIRDMRACMSVNVPAPLKRGKGLGMKGSEFYRTDEFYEWDGFNAFMKGVVDMRDSVSNTLKDNMLFRGFMSPNDLIRWNTDILNPHRKSRGDVEYMRYNSMEPIKNRMIYPDTQIEEKRDGIEFSLADDDEPWEITALSVRKYPKKFYLYEMNDLLGDSKNANLVYPCAFLIVTGARIGDYDSEKNTVVLKSTRAQQQADSPLARFQPELKDKNEDWKIMLDSYQKGNGAGTIYMQVYAICPKSQTEKAVSSIKGLWKRKNFELIVDELMQKQALFCALPMMFGPLMQDEVRKSRRLSTKTLTNIASLLPVIGEGQGYGGFLFPLIGRRGQVKSYNFYYKDTTNYNGCVIGSSGSGKSFACNEIARAVLSLGGKLFIIDVGHSYQKLCHLLRGQYIEIQEGENISFNPFWNITDIEKELELLVPLLGQMASPEIKIDSTRRSLLEQHIKMVWEEHGQATTVTLIRDSLSGAPEPEAVDLSIQLYPYTTEGRYGKYFHGPCTVEFDNNFVVLELEMLKQMPDLQSVVLMLIIYLINQTIFVERSERISMVLIDEAWQLMTGENTAEFIEGGYRRARKYNAGFWTSTQGFEEYGRTPSTRAALSNSNWTMLLKQKSESVEKMKNSADIVLNDFQLDELRGLIKTNVYSEMVVKASTNGVAVADRLVVDPYAALIYSSQGDLFGEIKYLRQTQGLSITEAVNIIYKRKEAERRNSVVVDEIDDEADDGRFSIEEMENDPGWLDSPAPESNQWRQ